MTLTTERPISNEDRMQMWEESLHRQGSGDCAPSTDGAAFSTEPEPDTLLWVTVFASLALTIAVLTAHVIWSVEEPEPDGPTPCGMRWTADAQYVAHYDYHDGRGCRP